MSRSTLVTLALLASGAAGLVHEIAWIQRSALTFGSTTLALSTVLGVFFLGLALGSRLFGALAVRTARPLLGFAWLELAVGALALLSLPLFEVGEALFGVAYREAGGVGLALARVGGVALVLLLPSMAMGGTLPLLCRQLVADPAHVARPVGRLYAVNTLGAAVGCLVSGFVLVPHLGITGSLVVGATLNVVAAGLTWLTRFPEARVTGEAPARTRASDAAQGETSWAIPAFFFAGGFVVLGLEVLWTRYLSLLVLPELIAVLGVCAWWWRRRAPGR